MQRASPAASLHRFRRAARGVAAAVALACWAGPSTGCSRGRSPWPALLVPVVSLVLEHELVRGRRVHTSARRLGALSVTVLLSFEGTRLRPALPGALDVSPALYALPCEDGDDACLVEQSPAPAAAGQIYGDTP